MKYVISFTLTLFLFCGTAFSQNELLSAKDTTSILKELVKIRDLQQAANKMQEDAKNKRDNDIAEWKEHVGHHKETFNDDPKSEAGMMAKIEGNTRQHPMKDGWNFYGIAAFIIAVLSAAIAWYTYKAQQRTEGNTKKLSQDAQRKLLNELLRHLYRNYVITYTMRTKMKDIDYKGYPSEEHFEKLKIPMENIHLDAFYGEDKKFQRMHVLYLNLRNYNEEVEVALKHIIDPVIKAQTKDEDFDTLEFKVSYLTGKIIDTIVAIWGDKPEYKEEMRKAMELSLSGETNATDNIDVPGSEAFDLVTTEAFKKTKYSMLYNDIEIEKVCTIFNNDVHEERKKNARGAWKVRIIKY